MEVIMWIFMAMLFDTTMVLPGEVNVIAVNSSGVDLRVVEGDSLRRKISIADAEGIDEPSIEVSGDTLKISIKCKQEKRVYLFGLIVSSGCFEDAKATLVLSGRWRFLLVDGDYSDFSLESGDRVSSIFINSSYGDFYLKNSTFSDAVLKTGYGDIRVRSITALNLNVSTDYGDVRMEDVNSKKISAYSDYGDLTFVNVHAEEMDVETDYGDIRLKNVRVPYLRADTHFGDMIINK